MARRRPEFLEERACLRIRLGVQLVMEQEAQLPVHLDGGRVVPA